MIDLIKLPGERAVERLFAIDLESEGCRALADEILLKYLEAMQPHVKTLGGIGPADVATAYREVRGRCKHWFV